jgi:hypothetical protein
MRRQCFAPLVKGENTVLSCGKPCLLRETLQRIDFSGYLVDNTSNPEVDK